MFLSGYSVLCFYSIRYHPAILKMKSVLQEYGRPVIGMSARYNCAYSTLDRPLWWNVDTSGGQYNYVFSEWPCNLLLFSQY